MKAALHNQRLRFSRMRATSKQRRRIASLVLATALIGATIGAALSVAFAEEITCSHEVSACRGTGGNDRIFGWENINEIQAREGRDVAYGYQQQDILFGSTSADALYGGEGGDSYVRGEEGNDSYLVVTGGANFGVYGNSQSDFEVQGSVGEDLVEGGTGEDNMYGGDHNDFLFAEDGQADTVNGGASTGLQPCYVDGFDAYFACEPH